MKSAVQIVSMPSGVGVNVMNQELLRINFGAHKGKAMNLTWAQAGMFRLIENIAPNDHVTNLKLVVPVARGSSLDHTAQRLRAIIESNDAMRMRLIATDGKRVLQAIVGSGTISIPVYHYEDFEIASTQEMAAHEIAGELAATRFDLFSELPFRPAVLLDKNAPVYIAISFSHLSIDEWGIRRFESQIHADMSPDEENSHLADRVIFEESADGERVRSASVGYLREQLKSIPHSLFPVRYPCEDASSMWSARLQSREAAAAADCLSRRHHVFLSSVLFAPAALLLGTRSKLQVAPFIMTVSNRFSNRAKDSLALLIQSTLVSVELKDSLVETFKEANFALMSAARRAQYAPSDLGEVLSEIRQQRGTEIDLSSEFNFKHVERPAMAAIDDWRALLPSARVEGPKSRYTFLGRRKRGTRVFDMRASIDRSGELDLSVQASANCLRPGEIEAFLRGFESLLIEAALHGDGSAERMGSIAPMPFVQFPAGEWEFVDGCWVELSAVRELVLSTGLCREVDVFAVFEDGIRIIVAFLTARDESVSPESVHTACVGFLGHGSAVVTPGKYVVVTASPIGAQDLDGWSKCGVLASGTGR